MKLENATIKDISRKSKFLIWYFSGKEDLYGLNHLGMTGVWYLYSDEVWKEFNNPFSTYKHYKLYLRLSDNTHLLFVNVRTFGRFLLLNKDQIDIYPAITNLGPDILDNDFDVEDFITRLRGKNGNRTKEIGKCLLDAKIVSGCGNIYKSEALHLAKINPFTHCNTLSDDEIEILGKSLVQVGQKALKFKGSTLRDYRHVDGYSGLMQNKFLVYDRFDKKCLTCSSDIKKAKQGDRTSYWCPSCQPLRS